MPRMFTVAAFYRFTAFNDPAAIVGKLSPVAEIAGTCGTILVAPEGLNGTIAGPRAGIDVMISAIRELPGCEDLTWKESRASKRPFKRMKVRLKREIVTMGQPHVDPNAGTGTYVVAADWNTLLSDPDVAVIDTRNDYEVAIGTFEGAVDPKMKSFGEFPAWWSANKAQFAGKKIAMFCTGGIRCEKSTNFLIQEGVEDVFHLEGGILKYLEDVPGNESTWRGECFVFDKRVSVGHGLREGPHILCHGCRRPLLAEYTNCAQYEAGVSCGWCFNETTDADKARFRERHRQFSASDAEC